MSYTVRAATLTAVSASISTPVRPQAFTLATIRIRFGFSGSKTISILSSPSG